MKKQFLAALLVLVLMLSLLSSAVGENIQEISLLFINVGKGDACLIQVGEKNYLIDVGPKDAHEALMEALETSGADCFEAIILTHIHKDHTGGLKKLLKNGISVKTLYYGALYTLEDKKEHPVLAAAEKYDIEPISLMVGDTLKLSEDVVLKVMAPFRADSQEDNNNSLVMLLSTPFGTALMTGDMEWEEEKELILSGTLSHCDILKVAHHGKDDTTGRNFVAITKPDYAVISTDTDEDDDTDSPIVNAILMDADCVILKTQQSQTGIRFHLSQEGISYIVE